MEQPIDESRLIKKEGSEQRFDEQTDQVELIGKEEGEERVLATMNFVPTDEKGFEIDYETAMKIASRHFEEHFNQIGWVPSGEYPDIIVKKREDGTWFGTAFLRSTGKSYAKEWGDFPRISHDDRGEEEALKDSIGGKTVTKF